MNRKNVIALVTSIILCEGAGLLGALFTAPAIPGWYAALAKPTYTPPSWLFGPMWTLLYLLMGVAAFLVWRKGTAKQVVRTALAVFGVQLVLNAAWSPLFFGLRNPGLAYVDIIALVIAIIVTITVFARVSRAAAWLLAPYLLWVAFAANLNLMIWILNPVG